MFKEVPTQIDFPKAENEILAFWEENKVYERSLEQRVGGKPFVFFEGPPTANGMPHPGHCLTRAMKDLFPRYKTMTGHYCLRKGGWDTHGLPVEVEVCKELGIHSKEEIETYGVEPFNRKCLESVFRYTKEWEDLTRRLGFWVNLDDAYVTYHQSYVESVWWSLKQLFDAGLLYQGHKIVWWWAQGGTALSAGEVGQGYREIDDASVFVRFPLVPDSNDANVSRHSHDGSQFGVEDSLDKLETIMEIEEFLVEIAISSDELERCKTADDVLALLAARNPRAWIRALIKVRPVSLLVWTTTPWTLPSNTFAAVHKDFDYAVVLDEENGERLIFAAALVDQIAKKAKRKSWKVEATVKGSVLIGLGYRPPFDYFYKRPARDLIPQADSKISLGDYKGELCAGGSAYACWRVVHADFVTLEAGTGLVHEAPAFGEVDYELMQQERLCFKNSDCVPLLCAVAPNGTFTHDAPPYEGRWVKDCDKEICRDMKDRGLLLHQEQYRHDYPFCWRAEEDPLIQYPRRSWFIRTTQFKDAMLENNRHINWLPEHIKAGRFGKFLESNVDWALSRERFWGTPLPIWVCEPCLHKEAIDSYEALVSKPRVDGLDVWKNAKRENPDLSDHLKVHKPYIDAIEYDCPKCEAGRMHRVPEVIDCWYDSGAMPFAQWGFPHKNRDMFERQFPADFISEALDQTRGWFYSLTAISVLLFGKQGVARKLLAESTNAGAEYPHPFRTCIVLGLLMGEDGLKMSKSKKNYKDPAYIFEHEGADAMRWLFFNGQTPWTSIQFKESAIAEGQREFLIRLYNCYSFLVIYANIDKWTPEQRVDSNALSEMDRWINSELDQCCLRIHDCMEAYDNFNACKALVEFVDALSNWYVRRSRDRFWRSGMDEDKKAAYTTLHGSLVAVSKLIAPFTPFIAESMYQNLVRTHDAEAPMSVHLCDYPIVEANRADVERRIDRNLNDEIALVRQLVSCGRAARSAAKLRVRQPLAAIELFHRSAEVIRRHEEIVKQELNVKRLDYVGQAQIDQYVHYEVKPDFKKIGPKHGRLAPKIKATLAKHPNADGIAKQLEQDGAYTLEVDGQSVELLAEELMIELHAREGWAAERIPGHGILALDAHLTPELRDEGMARDLVNHVQQIRKSLDLRYEQRIDLALVGDEDVGRVVTGFGDYIQGETLATNLLTRPIANIEPSKLEIDGHAVSAYVHAL